MFMGIVDPFHYNGPYLLLKNRHKKHMRIQLFFKFKASLEHMYNIKNKMLHIAIGTPGILAYYVDYVVFDQIINHKRRQRFRMDAAIEVRREYRAHFTEPTLQDDYTVRLNHYIAVVFVEDKRYLMRTKLITLL